ncbi:MAG: hypothetical protein AAF500_11090 [Myxococcota bacterium]
MTTYSTERLDRQQAVERRSSGRRETTAKRSGTSIGGNSTEMDDLPRATATTPDCKNRVVALYFGARA